MEQKYNFWWHITLLREHQYNNIVTREQETTHISSLKSQNIVFNVTSMLPRHTTWSLWNLAARTKWQMLSTGCLLNVIEECPEVNHYCLKADRQPLIRKYSHFNETTRFLHLFPFHNYNKWAVSTLKQIYFRDICDRGKGCLNADKMLDQCLSHRFELDFDKYPKSTRYSSWTRGRHYVIHEMMWGLRVITRYGCMIIDIWIRHWRVWMNIMGYHCFLGLMQRRTQRGLEEVVKMRWICWRSVMPALGISLWEYGIMVILSTLLVQVHVTDV
jgi:hypothetical protein